MSCDWLRWIQWYREPLQNILPLKRRKTLKSIILLKKTSSKNTSFFSHFRSFPKKLFQKSFAPSRFSNHSPLTACKNYKKTNEMFSRKTVDRHINRQTDRWNDRRVKVRPLSLLLNKCPKTRRSCHIVN